MPNDHEVIRAFIRLARAKGLYGVSRADVERAAKLPAGQFPHNHLTLRKLREQAVRRHPELGPIRSDADARDLRILRAAIELAREHGYTKITRAMIAKRAGIAESTVSNYGFERPSIDRSGTVMPTIRDDVMQMAVIERNLPIILQGIANNDPIAQRAPIELRQAALENIAA